MLAVVTVLWHPIEEELLILSIGGIGVALLLLPWILTIEHAVQVHLNAWVLSLQLAQHVLDITHDSLDVYEPIAILLLVVLASIALTVATLTVHVGECKGLRVASIVPMGPSALVLLLLMLLVVSLLPLLLLLLSVWLTLLTALLLVLLLLLLDDSLNILVVVLAPLGSLLLLLLLHPLLLPHMILMARVRQLLIDHVELGTDLVDVVVNLNIVVASVVDYLLLIRVLLA